MSALADRRLALISAPAGFGKTTAVTDWVRDSDTPACWLSLDAGDNDLHQLLRYMVLSLQQVDEHIGEGVSAALEGSSPPAHDLLLTELINDIAITEDPFILVLDDYHVIESQEVHDAIDFMLDSMPPQMHLAATSRVEPPWTLSRLRARGQLVEIRSADLRFTVDEATTFLNDCMDIQLSTEHVSALEEKTEGWIASLQLAALSLKGRENKTEFISSFSGSHRYIIDYLVDEVMSQQTEEGRAFLLGTSILERLHAPLCDAALGVTNSRKLLEQFDKANMFLIALDDDREWFRYHHLFSEFLSQRLSDEGPERISVLHRRASRWMQENKYTDQAFKHAKAAGDDDLAAEIVHFNTMSMIGESRLDLVLRWTESFSDDVMNAHPWLLVSRAWALLLSGSVPEVESVLDQLESAPQGTLSDIDYGLTQSHRVALRAYVARGMGDFTAAVDLSRKALDSLPASSGFLKCTVYANLALALYGLGELPESEANQREVMKFSPKEGSPYPIVTSRSWVGMIKELEGKLSEAVELYQKGIELGTGWGGIRPMPVTGGALIGMGRVYYERNDLSEAESHIAQGIELGEQGREIAIAMLGHVAMMKLRQAEGRPSDATEALNKAREFAPGSKRIFDASLADSWRALLSLRQGDLKAASSWAESAMDDSSESEFKKQRQGVTVARIFLATGKEAEAIELLGHLLGAVEAEQRMGEAIEILVVQALAFEKSGKQDRAIVAITRALDLAEPEGYVRTFIDEGEPMADLLRVVATKDSPTPYVRKLLDAFAAEGSEPERASSPPSSQMTGYLVDPLSERELEVLSHMARGQKYQEIADQLFVSINTVRTHTKSIYSKLQVNSKTDAINKGRELELI